MQVAVFNGDQHRIKDINIWKLCSDKLYCKLKGFKKANHNLFS